MSQDKMSQDIPWKYPARKYPARKYPAKIYHLKVKNNIFITKTGSKTMGFFEYIKT